MSNHVLALLVISCLSFLNAEFTCPTDHITKDSGVTGVIPAGATDQVKVPAGTKCTYVFDIPKGFAIKMETSTDYDVSPGDYVMFDSFFVSPPVVNDLEYAMNTSVQFDIYSKTGNLTFMAKYSYLDLTHYQQVVKPTGAYFNTTLEAGKYYTVKASTAEEKVNLNYGSRENGFVDHTVYEVFIFDGNDIVNSKYIGRVSSVFFRRYEYVSTSNTLTLLNLYNTPSDSLFLGNDASVIEPMDVYSVFVLDSDQALDSWMGQVEEPFKKFDAWYTVICNGCSSFAINYMMFESNWGYGNPNGYVAIQGMTPTDKLKPVLTYPYSTNNNASFPQIITAPIATFHLFNASVHFNLSPGSQQQDFGTAPGESRSIYSPQLWNPDATPSFDYTFSDPMAVYNFSIKLNTLALENDGDELDVEVGSVNGLTTLEKKYTKTKLTNEVISGLGKYLKLKYTGSKSSEVDLSFLMIDPSNPDGTTRSPATDGTTQSPATDGTTQSPGTTNSDTTVSTSVGTSVSTRATRVSISTIAPVTSPEVTSTSRLSTSVGTTQSVATVASTSTRASTSARVSTSTRTSTSTVDSTSVASSTLAPSTSTPSVTSTKVSSSTALQTSTTETSTSAPSTNTAITTPSPTATSVVISTTSIPRTTFISTTSEVHASTIIPESSSTSSLVSASVTTSTFLPSSTTGITSTTSTVTTPTTSTEVPTTSKLIISTSTDVPTTSTSEPSTTTLITTKLITYTASPTTSTLDPTKGIVSTTVTTPITSTEAPTTSKMISSTTTLLTTSTALPSTSTITPLLPTSTTTKPTPSKPSSSTITSFASTSASTQSKQVTSSWMLSSSSTQSISTASAKKSTVVVQTTEPVITQAPVVPIIVSTLAPSTTTRASRTQTSYLSTVQSSPGSTQSTQSTQTTPSTVETTTSGAASLLPTGLFILVISNLFF